ncbi:MAG: hypothetical protein HYW89_03985 [Candidatus Sungiibacteriota bacterium]|uniref:Cytochrome C biogenesis protein transmembrane domain-containing protein n=1 Tax=Candidatus Sungiibacteriota bacterium TaxID=2750080 RepID=A0A7T5RJ96_9BACT|nr:MAG: hypothetical protein HYW89_03985 [Candidatus Sungbacteria bacterium]
MDLSLVIPAFIAGILTFLAPCTLPLVPGYLGFISGASLEDLKDPMKASTARRKIFRNGLFFILGFSAVFIIMGTLVGFVGASLLAPYRFWLSRIGGVFVILFGLFMLHPVRNPPRFLSAAAAVLGRLISNGVNVLKISFLVREKQLKAPGALERGKSLTSFILGSAFAFGWTPCVGPILGSILLLASTSTTAFQGSLLLAVFSAGLAVPFLLVALGIGSAAKFISKISKFLSVVSVIGGLLLIFLGILLLTGNMALLISWGYRLFQFINYERLLDYL